MGKRYSMCLIVALKFVRQVQDPRLSGTGFQMVGQVGVVKENERLPM